MSAVVSARQPCPSCTSSDAYFEYDDGHGFCFSCGKYFKPKRKGKKDLQEYSYQFVPLRGITKESLQFYDAKTKVDAEGKPVAIGFKYPNGSLKIRSLDKKEFHTEGEINKAGLFGRDKFAAGSHKYVTITEGELDAISLYQTLRSPVVSVQSSSTAARDCAVDIDFLRSFERIYLAFDNDVHGRAATELVAKLFDYRSVYVVKFSNRKDANEYLQAGEDSVLRNIWWNSKKYQPESIVSSNDEFKKLLEEEPQYGISYPFRTLTEMTYGIRRGESVLITAMEGIGKTELMHAIEHHILKETDENVASIFLEEPKRRHLQALAGIELGKPVHLPDSGVTNAEVYDAVERLLRRDDRLFIYSHYGSDDPDVLLQTVRFLVTVCQCPYVLLDHISMVVSGLAGEDERIALDYIITRLEMMVVELNFALIFVSHVNDEGLTRGSRGISKIANIRIDAKRDVLNKDPNIRNTLNLSISKNRFHSNTGPAGSYLFDPYSRKYTEIVAANDNSVLEAMAA